MILGQSCSIGITVFARVWIHRRFGRPRRVGFGAFVRARPNEGTKERNKNGDRSPLDSDEKSFEDLGF